MGYSMFANRKIYYTNLIYTLQSKLDNITQQKQSLLNFSANISDGVVTVEEIAGDATNYNNYLEYLAGAEAYVSTSDEDGGAEDSINAILGIAAEEDDSDEYLATIAELLSEEVNEEYAKQYTKKLEALENELDLQQQKIQTQIDVAQSDLEAAEEAEADAIEKATPKYNGVG